MRGHVDTESLALHAEGLLGRGQRARVESHLSGCPQCRATQQQLAGVSAMLSQVPAPDLPPDVAGRLDLALSAEVTRRAAERAAAGPSATPAADGSRHPARHRGRAAARGGRPARWPESRRWSLRSSAGRRLAGALAGVAVVLAGAGYGLTQLTGPAGSGASSGAAAPSSQSSPNPQHFSNGVALPRLVQSRTDYQPGKLGQQAATVLAGHAAGVPAGGGIVPATNGGASRQGPAATPPSTTLLTCANAVAHGRHVVLIDEARYAGRPAYVVFLGPAGSGRYTAVVIGPGCLATHHAAVIKRAQFTRP